MLKLRSILLSLLESWLLADHGVCHNDLMMNPLAILQVKRGQCLIKVLYSRSKIASQNFLLDNESKSGLLRLLSRKSRLLSRRI